MPATTLPRIEVAALQVRYGDHIAVHDIDFSVAAGELVTLLGPSGCGKTTTLRSIAGLETPSLGRIALDGLPVYCSAARRNVPSEKRGVSMVFQSYAIWPHMTVYENVAYGLRVRRMGNAELHEHVHRALDLVQMRDFADRSAAKLSGGQQQRVAVARAIAFSPEVLLFDEPLSNLDAKLRAEMRVELRELQKRLGITSLYVTHDQEEALAISDRVIVMRDGRIEQIGAPEQIYGQPCNRFVADFVGCANLIPGHLRNGTDKPVFETQGGLMLPVSEQIERPDNSTTLAVRPTYVSLSNGASEQAPDCLVGQIHRRMFHGDYIQYIVDWPAGQLIVRRPPTEVFPEGSKVAISFAAEHCVLLQA
jgi:iron(III) transport system ATP-binding protein